MIQQMKEYQLALQYAVDKNYPDSLSKLREAATNIEQVVGSAHTQYHLFLYQRMASIQQMLGDINEVEGTFRRCVETAEKIYQPHKGTKGEDMSKIFMWQNNLLKFYLEYNVDQACDYGNELVQELQERLPKQDMVDLYFSTATALALQGSQLGEAETMYEQALAEIGEDQMTASLKPFLLNNLGVTHFHQFVEKSS
jgi:tetratricopeptide (TPR) repeat protein